MIMTWLPLSRLPLIRRSWRSRLADYSVAAHRAAIGPHPSSVPMQSCQIVVVALLLCLAQSSTRSHETQPKFLAPANWWAREHGELVELALSIVRD